MKKLSFVLLLLLFLNGISYTQYKVDKFLQVRGASSPQYSFDNKRYYFIQNVTGTNQLWMMDKPGGWAYQITFFNEPVAGYYVNPKSDIIAAELSKGGSEYNQLYLMNGDGTDVKTLTDNAKVRYRFGQWSDDGSYFTYYSNERNPSFYDIYRHNIYTGISDTLHISNFSNYPQRISPNGVYLLFKRSYTNRDEDLFLLNLISGDIKNITPHNNIKDPAEFNPISFTNDSREIYLLTNQKSEFRRLAKYDIISGKMEMLYPEFLDMYSIWDINGGWFSPDKSKMLLRINVNGYDRMKMADIYSLKEIELPAQFNYANVTAVRFSNYETRMMINYNNAVFPGTVWEWNWHTDSLIQLTYPSFASIPKSIFIEPSLIKYKSFDDREISAFMYMPKYYDSTKKVPVIINIHGGPEAQSSYGFSSIIQFYLNLGYAVVEPNVRGSSGYGKTFSSLDDKLLRENSVKDIEYLVKYLRASEKIDDKKIVVMGGSYGGYMVLACLANYPDMFAAGISTVGISNFITFLRNTADYRRKNRESEYGELEHDSLFLASISPVNKVHKINKPLMLIHGRNDPRVPVGEAIQMYEALKKQGNEAELLIYEDEGHGLSKMKNRMDAYPKIVDFLDKHLKSF